MYIFSGVYSNNPISTCLKRTKTSTNINKSPIPEILSNIPDISATKIPYFTSITLYYRDSLCFVRCSPLACIPKEVENGMFELRTPHSVSILPYEIAEISLDIMILSPVNSYSYYTLSIELAKLGLLLLNSIHIESNTGTVTLIVKNMSASKIDINKSSIIVTMIVNPRLAYKYFCIEGFELTRSPHELRKLFDVCKAKEDHTLFKI